MLVSLFRTRLYALYMSKITFFFSPDQESITQLAAKLKGNGLEVEIEDYIAGFLGVHIKRKIDAKNHLTQLGLIDRIVKALNLQSNQHLKATPAEQGCLGANIDGGGRKGPTIIEA
jgi:hypothetical protein